MPLIGRKSNRENDEDDMVEYLDLQDYRFDTIVSSEQLKSIKVVDVERVDHVKSRIAKLLYQKNIVIVDISNAGKDLNNLNQIEVAIKKLIDDVKGDYGRLGELYYVLTPNDVFLDKKKIRDEYI